MRTRSSQAVPDFPHPTGFVLVAAANPGERHHQVVLVPSVGRAVEQLVCAVERVEAAGVARVGAVDDAVLQSERAQTRHLRGERLLVEVVPGAIRTVVAVVVGRSGSPPNSTPRARICSANAVNAANLTDRSSGLITAVSSLQINSAYRMAPPSRTGLLLRRTVNAQWTPKRRQSTAGPHGVPPDRQAAPGRPRTRRSRPGLCRGAPACPGCARCTSSPCSRPETASPRSQHSRDPVRST